MARLMLASQEKLLLCSRGRIAPTVYPRCDLSRILGAALGLVMARQLEQDEACEFCYAPAVAVCIHCGTAVCKECAETKNGRTVCNDCIEGEDSEFEDGGEG